MRIPTLRLSSLVVPASLVLVLAACGADPAPKADTTTVEDTEGNTDEDVATGEDGGGSDGSTRRTDAGGGSDASDGAAVDAVIEDTETPDTVADAEADTPAPQDTETPDTAADTAAQDVPPKPKLPLPDCAQGSPSNCLNFDKCPKNPICIDGTTYANDCEAIVKLNSFEGLDPFLNKLLKGACPECAACGSESIKCNTQTKLCALCTGGTCKDTTTQCQKTTDCGSLTWCATLNNGAKVEVNLPCKAKCLDLDTKFSPNPSVGACKSMCSQPPPKGAGCPMNSYQPVCAKEDGKTYANACALQNCDLQGCYAVGSAGKTDLCAPKAMTVECEGECFAEASKVTPEAANCPKDCNPVCGVTALGVGRSFRNQCLAVNAGAKVGDCTGMQNRPWDKCSAELYKGKGCCADVDYSYLGIKPVCGSRLADKAGDPDTWVTFRNMAEYKCLTAGDNKWTLQYMEPCKGNCPLTGTKVCGDDGNPYENACVAEYWNKDLVGFTYYIPKDGAKCPNE